MSPILAYWGLIAGLLTTLAAAMFVTLLALAAIHWVKIRRLGAPLSFSRYMVLRWRGVSPAALAAAYWSAGALGGSLALEEWNSFAVLGVDVLRLAGALAAAQKASLQANLALLGAAALAGYDPVDVVKESHRRGLAALTNNDLQQLPGWGLERRDKPV